MISPAEIRQKALRQYPQFLSAMLTRQRFFPLPIKGNKGKATDAIETLYPALRRLIEGEKKRLGYGYTVSLKTVNTRHAGEMSMPDEIYFENVEDYLKFIDKEGEFLAFRDMAQRTRKELPELLNWMADNPLKVVKSLEIWKNLLTVAVFFQKNPRPNLYARALPIDVPTVFIEDNQNILAEILCEILPIAFIDAEADVFEQKFGLLYNQPLVRVRTLDKEIEGLFSITKDISLPIADWNAQEVNAQKAFLIMDKLDFLRFPDKEKCIAIWLDKMSFDKIQQLNFLQKTEIYFWGNMSVPALQILADLRSHFPKAKSFCMNLNLLKRYEENIEGVKYKNEGTIFRLDEEEEALLKILMEGKRLLSKHIRQEDVLFS